MNTKPPLQIPAFISSTGGPPSPSLCFPTGKKVEKKEPRSSCCCCRKAPKSRCISALGVLILVIVYTGMGSILFITLEGDIEDFDTIETAVAASKPYPRTELVNPDIRKKTVDRLWSITEELNILYKDNWTILAAQEVQYFQDTILSAVRASRSQQISTIQSPIKPYKWTYASAFLYSLTLITTIGYGGVAPKTQWGRIAALIYALFGIPLILLYLSAMGEGLSSIMRCMFRKLRSTSSSSSSKSTNSSQSSSTNSTPGGSNSSNKSHNTYSNWSHHNDGYGQHPHGHNQQQQQQQQQQQSVVPISICIMILICYITLGAVLFHKIQSWNVLESIYFCFTSLGTIGFGDITPKGNLAQYIASGYILFGMAVVAMCFNLIQSELVIWLRKFGIQQQDIIGQQSSQMNTDLNDIAMVPTVTSMTPIKS